MRNSVYLILFIVAITGARGAEQKAEQRVIDLGQIEIEGEVRRPNVSWIDSQKRLKDMLPIFHRSEFLALEEELLRPLSLEQLNKKNGAARASR